MVCISIPVPAEGRISRRRDTHRALHLPEPVERDRREREATAILVKGRRRKTPAGDPLPGNITGIAGNAPRYLSISPQRV
jgi:hypothetical protein